jgi:hypothetical protein
MLVSSGTGLPYVDNGFEILLRLGVSLKSGLVQETSINRTRVPPSAAGESIFAAN